MSPGNDEGRPRQEAPLGSSTTAIVTTDRRRYRRLHWAFPLIRRGGDNIPIYGSDEWLVLADSDPVKIASCVRAAETWARAGDDLETELRREVEESRRAFKATEDAEYVARRDAHRRQWRHLSVVRGIDYTESNARYLDGVL